MQELKEKIKYQIWLLKNEKLNILLQKNIENFSKEDLENILRFLENGEKLDFLEFISKKVQDLFSKKHKINVKKHMKIEEKENKKIKEKISILINES